MNALTKVEEALCNAVDTQESVTAVPVVPVKLKSTYAMFDTCSTSLFILDDIPTTLGSKAVNTKFFVKTSFLVILLFLNKDFVALVSFSSCLFSAKNRFSFKVNAHLLQCMCFVVDRCRTHQL